MRLRLLALVCATMLSTPVIANANGGPMGGHAGFAAGQSAGFGHISPNHPAGSIQRWPGHPGWSRGGAHFNRMWWRAGSWWHGVRGRRFGWWWVVGPAWYWYPAAVYPYPDFSTPPYLPPGYLYWCDFYLNYYPDVSDCPTGWHAVPSFNGAVP